MASASTSTPALLLNEKMETSGLSDSQAVNCVVVHPMVLLSVLDHHTRRQDGEGRVIGTLLGRRDGNKVEVTNCFAVPHTERGNDVAIGKDFNRQMLALHLRANRNETVVGWYATAFPTSEDYDDEYNSPFTIPDTSSPIHDFYAGECEDTIMDSPVHLVVDTSLVQDTIGLRAYMSNAVTLHGEELASMFNELRLVLKSSESERIVLDEMVKGLGGGDSDAAPAVKEEDKEAVGTTSLQCSMEKLLSMLETASEYVGKVVDGSVEADDSVGRQIADTLSSVPRIRPEAFEKMFNDSLQDLLMVTYLSNITRTQLTIAEKLNSALDVNLK